LQKNQGTRVLFWLIAGWWRGLVLSPLSPGKGRYVYNIMECGQFPGFPNPALLNAVAGARLLAGFPGNGF